jgi:hypothetical protein
VDVNQVYKTILRICEKNLQNGYISPDDFYYYINEAQRQYTDFLLGEYQRYQVRRPISIVQFGQNERIRKSLLPLVYGAVLNIPPTGIISTPSDFEYPDAMWGQYGYYNIKFIQQDRLASYLHSRIDPIQQNPIYLIQHEGFHFFPPDIGVANLSYIRTPPSIVWGYRLDSNGVPVYDATKSQDPVWGETDIHQIIVRALQMIGVSLQLGVVMQYANDIKANGA